MGRVLACAVLAACTVIDAAAADLARGARGHGFSVFEGQQLERFEVEILGVLHDSATIGDSYLARLSGADLEHTGVLQGMSGSPVYVDGELIGAVMATWAFAKDPICTIRPIGEMRELAEDLDRGRHPGYRPGDSKARAPALDPPVESSVMHLLLEGAPSFASEVGSDVAWMASGFATPLLQNMQARLGSTVQSAQRAGRSDAVGRATLRGGEAMAVLLVDGAATLSAVGTVTERDGDRILAFGHPMLGNGPTSLPIARASILAGMASSQISFKIAEVGDVVGALLLDQRPGLVGMLGVEAEMLPLRVVIDDREYVFRLGRVAALLPDLAGWCARTALLDRDPVGDDALLRLRAQVDFEGDAPLRSEASVDGSLAASSVGAEIALLLQLAIARPEWAGALRSAEIHVERAAVARRARVERVLVRPERPRPGDELSIRVQLREDGGATHWEQLALRVPQSPPVQPLRLHVGDGSSSFQDELMRAAQRWEDPGTTAIRDALERRSAASTLVAVLYSPVRTVLVGDRELGPLPPSTRALLLDGAGRGVRGDVLASAVARVERSTPWLLRGQDVVEIPVEPRSEAARKEAP